MAKLLRYLMTTTIFNDTCVPQNLKSNAENYLRDESSVFIVTGSSNCWEQFLINTPKATKKWTESTASFAPSPGVLLDIRTENITLDLLRPKNLRFYSKVLVIAEGNKKQFILDSAVKLGICKLMLLTVQNGHVGVANITNVCKGIGTDRIPEPSDNCRANVSILELPPYVILEEGKLSGFEGTMIQTIADHMNIMLTVINHHEAGYGQFSPPSGLLGDMETGESMAAFGTIYPWHKRWLGTEMIFGCQGSSMAWSAPIGAGHSQPTWSIILISEFSATVWAVVLTLYILLIPISILFDSGAHNHLFRPFHIFALIIGTTQTWKFQKKFSMIIVFLGFMISTYYQAMMSTKLTVPKKIPEITNMKELASSRLKLSGPVNHGRVMQEWAEAFPQDKEKQIIMQRFEATETAASQRIVAMTKTREFCYLRHGFTISFLASQNPETAGKVHIIEEAVAKYYPVVLTPKNSCLAPRIQDLVLRLCAGGLCRKWMDDFTTVRKAAPSKHPRRLNMEHIRGFLYLILIGWPCAIVAFLCEIWVNWMLKKYSDRRFKIHVSAKKHTPNAWK